MKFKKQDTTLILNRKKPDPSKTTEPIEITRPQTSRKTFGLATQTGRPVCIPYVKQ